MFVLVAKLSSVFKELALGGPSRPAAERTRVLAQIALLPTNTSQKCQAGGRG